MREKQQKTPWRATAAVAATAVGLTSWLAVSAMASAVAAPTTSHGAPVKPALMVAGQPNGIAVDTTTHTFWVSQLNNGGENDFVDSIAEGSHATKSFNVQSGVDGVAVDSGLGLVWTFGNGASGTTHTVTPIKEPGTVMANISVGASSSLTGVAVDPAVKKAFVLDAGGDVFAFDETHPGNAPTKLVNGTLTSADAIAVDPGTGTIWVVDAGNNAVREFSVSTGAAIGTPIGVGTNPGGIAVDPTAKTVWVSNSNSTVSEFGESSPGTVHTIKLPASPESIAVDSKTGVAWVGVGFGSIVGISAKTSPPSSIGTVTPAPDPIVGIAIDAANGQVWAADDEVSQNHFNNVFPLLPTAPKFTSPASTWLATNSTSQQSFAVKTTAFPPATFSLSGGPSFLSIGRQTGLLTGKLTAKSKPGAFKVTIAASNGIGAAAHQTLTVNVGSDPVLVTTSGTFAIGVKNSLHIKASGTPAPAYSGISLPSGLTLSTTGQLSGTLPKGTKSPVVFGVELTNKVTTTFSAPVVALFTLKLAPGKAPKLTSASKVSFKHGKQASFTVKSTGFPSPALKITGKLPTGLKFKAGAPGTGTISGIPATATKGHTFKITITASNGVGKAATQTLSIKIT